jgi:RDD family.
MDDNVRTAEEMLPPDDELPKPILIRGKNGTRLLAELADIFLTLILGIVLYSLCFSPLYGYDAATSAQLSAAQKAVADETASYLVGTQENGAHLFQESLRPIWIKSYFDGNSETSGKSSDCLYNYYHLYRVNEKYDAAAYDVAILGLPADPKATNPSPYFVYDSTLSDPTSGLGVLSPATKTNLGLYYQGNQTAEPLAAFKGLCDFFDKAYETAWSEFALQEPYQGDMVAYSNATYKVGFICTGAALTSYVVSSLVFFLLVPLIGKKGTTLGKKILKVQPLNKDGSPLKVWQMFARAGVELLEYVFLVPFLPVMILGVSGFTLPLIRAGSLVISLMPLLIAGLVVTLGSTLLLIFQNNHQSLHDFASRSFVYTSDYAIIDAERAKREEAARAEEENHARN